MFSALAAHSPGPTLICVHTHARFASSQCSAKAGYRVQVLFINLGKNKETQDGAADFVEGVEKLMPFADAIVINVSSPNTPGMPTPACLAPCTTLGAPACQQVAFDATVLLRAVAAQRC